MRKRLLDALALAIVAAALLFGAEGCSKLADPMIGAWFFFGYLSPRPTVTCLSRATGTSITVNANARERFCQ